MGILYKIQSKVFKFIGDIKCSGWKRPFWFTVNAGGYRLKGEHYRRLQELLQPGDILIRRFEGYIDKWFIPGYWNHAGMYVGSHQVVHAISEGVIQEDILNFMRTDEMCVLRVNKSLTTGGLNSVSEAIAKAMNIVGAPYDFGFDFEESDRFSCTELIAHCYPELIKPAKRWSSLGKAVIVADDIVNCEKLQIVWDSRKPEVFGFSVTSQ